MKLISLYSLLVLSNLYISIQSNQNLPEKKIVIVIPSYNNPLKFTRECLESVLMQKYSNYEILFSDDCSPQPNIEQIHKQLIAELDMHKRITYRRNKQRLGPLGNRWNAIHSINQDNIEDNRNIIVANLDGDDIFLRSDALTIINEMHEYAWTTWGSFSILPSKNIYSACQPVPAHVIAQNNWRSCPISLSHVQTYRLSLLKDLPLYTYLYHGNFYPAATDLQSIWGACEKSGIHTAFNPIPVYGYRLHPQNEMNREEGRKGADCLAHAKAQTPFQPLQALPFQRPLDSYHADLIIFSENDPLTLSEILQAVKKNIPDLQTTFVLYKKNEQFSHTYDCLRSNYPDIRFIEFSLNSDENLKNLLLDCLKASTSDYVLFLRNEIPKTFLPIKNCIRALLKTHGYMFYTCSENLPSDNLIDIDDTMVAWSFDALNNRAKNWHLNKFFNLTLFAKKQIIESLFSVKHSTINTIESQWNNYVNTQQNTIGLGFSPCIIE